MSIFTRHLGTLYKRLGTVAAFTPAGGAPLPDPVRVIFDTPGGVGLDGEQQMLAPVVRLQTSEVAAVPRGSLFVIDGVTWKAREAGLPLLDGAELQVPLAKV